MPSTTATRDSDGRRATALAPATGTLGSQPTTGDRRPRGVRPGVLLTIVLTAQLMAILDVNIVNVAAATIRTDLHTSGAALLGAGVAGAAVCARAGAHTTTRLRSAAATRQVQALKGAVGNVVEILPAMRLMP